MLSLDKQRPVKQSRALKLQTYIWGVMIVVLRVCGLFFASDVIKVRTNEIGVVCEGICLCLWARVWFRWRFINNDVMATCLRARS